MILCFILISSIQSGWTLIAEMHDNAIPVALYESHNGGFVVRFQRFHSDTFWVHEVQVDMEGSVHGTCSDPWLTPASGPILFASLPVPEEDFTDFGIPSGVIHFDSSGHILWSTVLDTIPDYERPCMVVIPSSNGGCFAVSEPQRGEDTWRVYSLSEDGEVLMRNEFNLQGGPMIDLCHMIQTPDNDYLLTGVTDSLGMNLYMFVIKLDNGGNVVWMVLERVLDHGWGNIVDCDEDGNVFVVGSAGYEREDGYFMPPVDQDLFLMKLDGSGMEEWRTVFEYPQQNVPIVFRLLSDGSICIIMKAFPEGYPGESNYLLLRYTREE